MYAIGSILILTFITLVGIVGGCEGGTITIPQMLEYSLLTVVVAAALSLVIVGLKCAVYMHDKKVRAQAIRNFKINNGQY